MPRRVGIAFGWVLLVALVLGRPSQANAGPVLTVGSATVGIGDTFTVPVSIDSAAGLTSFQFDLAFNPTVVNVLGFSDSGTDFEAAASAGGGFLTGITGFVDNTTGLLSGVADSMSGLFFGNGLTPGGTLVFIQFQALASGLSPLSLSNAFLIDDGLFLSSDAGDFVVADGQVRVPEPASLLLFASGLGALLLRCRHKRARSA